MRPETFLKKPNLKPIGFIILFLLLSDKSFSQLTSKTAHQKGKSEANSSSFSIEDYIKQAGEKNPTLKAFQLSLEASDIKKATSEAELAPLFTAGYLNEVDRSIPSPLGSRRTSEIYSLGLAKKFSTGTSFKLEAQNGNFENEGVLFPGFDLYSTGLLGVRLQQSLWKDFFGHGTRTRISRIEKLIDLEKLSQELQSRAALYEIETQFWDYALALEDFKLKNENLSRAQKIEKWTANRYSNGISDRADLMNAKALVAIREAQLLAASEDLKTQEVKLKSHIGLTDQDLLPQIVVNLNLQRPYLENLLKKDQAQIKKIEALISAREAEVKALSALEAEDNIKPDLSVFASYATTSYNRDQDRALAEIYRDRFPRQSIGLNFSWYIGNPDSITATGQSAKKEALAAQFKADKKNIDGADAWKELKRKYEISLKSIQVLEKVALYQRERALAEQAKLSRGRTITAQVVTAETEAAESEITLLKSKTNLRKLEASSLFFIVGQE